MDRCRERDAELAAALRASLARQDGGQSAIVITAFLFMFAVFGFAVIDVGVAWGARRDAQTDADLIALAGAIELINFDDDEAGRVAAKAAAEEWALANDVDVDPSQLTVTVVRDCFSQDDGYYTGVDVRVERSPPGFFFGIFPGVPQLEVSSEARACSGAPQEMSGFMPWAIETAGDCFTNEPDPADRTPILGERCDLSVGGLGGESGDVGQLALSQDPSAGCEAGIGSAAVHEDNIINGVLSSCQVGESVTSNTGVNVGKTKSGLKARLATEGACSLKAEPIFDSKVVPQTNTFDLHPTITDLPVPDLGGVDDFFEVWRPGLGYDPSEPGDKLEQYNCNPDPAGIVETSPRNVSVIIVTDIAVDDGSGCTGTSVGASPHCYLVLGFARMYIEGCTTSSAGFSAMCDQSGGGATFTIHARFVKATTTGDWASASSATSRPSSWSSGGTPFA